MRYKVGMYGGSFNPIHMGHVNCIIQAANMCEKLYIVLSIGTNRNEIDYRVRYRWLYVLTKHIGNVKILMLEDSAETKADYTEEYWMADARKVKKQIGKNIDVVFCGSDYDDESFWNVCYPESELFIIERNGISSTEIRKNPYKHWEWIPKVARPYFTKKVLLVGGESTGKSTLTINLANYFNTNYIDEAGRDISERSGTDLLMIPEDYTDILLHQKMNEIKAMENCNKVLFEDTDALITQFFMNFLEEDDAVMHNKVLSDAIDGINEFDLILFLEPDVAFVQDGGRSPVIENNREKYSNQIKDILDAHGRTYHCIKGSYQERFEQAVRLVKKFWENK